MPSDLFTAAPARKLGPLVPNAEGRLVRLTYADGSWQIEGKPEAYATMAAAMKGAKKDA